MLFDVLTYPCDGWRGTSDMETKRLLFQIEADTVEQAVKLAAKRIGARVKWSHGDTLENVTAFSHFRDKNKWMLKQHQDFHRGEPRVWVTHYPHVSTPDYAGPVTRHGNEKAAVTAAFKELRREGFAARQNFMCCGGCAGSAMPDDKPGVYYHRQADDRSWHDGHGWTKGQRVDYLCSTLHISYGDVDGGDDREVGIKLYHALQRNGLHVEWDGNPANCVIVLPERDVRRAAAA